jgi:multicomponent Na+:H+ antiporter subunit E
MLYLLNLLLALAWAAVTGSFTLANLILGFVLGAATLYLIREQTGSLSYFIRIWRVFSLIALFLYELVLSAIKVALLVVQPRMDLKPGILKFPLRLETDASITLLANLITLTPGTLTIDASEDRRFLWVHALDCSNPDKTREEIASGFERKIMEAFK